MLAQGQVGPVAQTGSLSQGSTQTHRLGNMGGLIVSEVHGRYYESTYRNATFTAYAAGTLLSLAGVAMTGLQLWNGSTNRNILLLKLGGIITVTSATMTGIALAVGVGQPAAPTGQTVITASGPNLVGGTASVATPMNAGTFVNAPSPRLALMHNTAAIATTGVDNGFDYDMEGSFIIPPQTYACMVALGAASAAAAFTGHIMWEEIPI